MSDDLGLLTDTDTIATNGHDTPNDETNTDMTSPAGDEAAGEESSPEDAPVSDDALDNVEEEANETSPADALSPQMVYQGLNSAGYICDQRLAQQTFMCLNTRPVAGGMLKGPSGAGKTMLTEVVADVFGMEYFYRQATPETREGQLLLDLWPSEETESGIKKIEGPITKAVRSSLERPTRS